MRIIDDKGRLFGKINVIDFLVILFLFFLMPMFYFGYKIFNKKSEVRVAKQEEPKKEFIEIQISCLFVKLNPEVAGNISIGDKELDENGDSIGEIIEVGKVAPYVYKNIDISSGKKFNKEDPLLKQLPAKMKLKVEIMNNNIHYKNQQVLDDGNLEFKIGRYLIKAESVSIIKDDSVPLALDTLNLNSGKSPVEIIEEKLSNLENKTSQQEEKSSNLEKKVDSLLLKKR